MIKKRNSKNKKLGYRDFISVHGEKIRLDSACKLYPVEVFKLVDSKSIMVADRIYMNLLDVIRNIDEQLYFSHRQPYHQQVVAKANKLTNYELDYLVRNKLYGKGASKIQLNPRQAINSRVFKCLNSRPDDLNFKIRIDKKYRRKFYSTKSLN